MKCKKCNRKIKTKKCPYCNKNNSIKKISKKSFDTYQFNINMFFLQLKKYSFVLIVLPIILIVFYCVYYLNLLSANNENEQDNSSFEFQTDVSLHNDNKNESLNIQTNDNDDIDKINDNLEDNYDEGIQPFLIIDNNDNKTINEDINKKNDLSNQENNNFNLDDFNEDDKKDLQKFNYVLRNISLQVPYEEYDLSIDGEYVLKTLLSQYIANDIEALSNHQISFIGCTIIRSTYVDIMLSCENFNSSNEIDETLDNILPDLANSWCNYTRERAKSLGYNID